jgi:hypothetical protein
MYLTQKQKKMAMYALGAAMFAPVIVRYGSDVLLSAHSMLPKALQLSGMNSNLGAIQMNPRHMGAIHKGAIHKGAIHMNPRHMGAIAYRQYPGVVNM